MSGKYCKDCKYRKRAAVQHQNQAAMIDICMHEEFGDPVSGEPLPCGQVRGVKEFCGLTGKGFVVKPEEPRVMIASG